MSSGIFKSCPFCGGEAKLAIRLGQGHIVICSGCGAAGPIDVVSYTAAELWNRRADDWIGVEKQLPEPDIIVMVTDTTVARRPALGTLLKEKYDGKNNWRVVPMYGTGYQSTFITHWRPLPELPQVSSEQSDEPAPDDSELYEFHPRSDITLYELAKVIARTYPAMPVDANMALSGIVRHFRKRSDESRENSA